MNTFFIRLFFSIICLLIFLYVLLFGIYEIKNNHNMFGGILTLIVTISSIIFSNIVFWIN